MYSMQWGHRLCIRVDLVSYSTIGKKISKIADQITDYIYAIVPRQLNVLVVKNFFFMLALLVEYIFLNTSYGIYVTSFVFYVT